jgi:hypothetical protein
MSESETQTKGSPFQTIRSASKLCRLSDGDDYLLPSGNFAGLLPHRVP